MPKRNAVRSFVTDRLAELGMDESAITILVAKPPAQRTKDLIAIFASRQDDLEKADILDLLAFIGDVKRAGDFFSDILEGTDEWLKFTVAIHGWTSNKYKTHQRFTQVLADYLQGVSPVEAWGRSSFPSSSLSKNATLPRTRTADNENTEASEEEEETLYKRALALMEQVPELAPSVVATCLYNLARLYHRQRRYAEAELQYQRALAMAKQGKPDFLNVAHIFKSYGALLRETNRLKEAATLETHKKTVQEKQS